VALIALVVQTGMLVLALFEPSLPYKIENPAALDIQSDQFLRSLSTLTGGYLRPNNTVEVLANGENFYEAELAAIRSAKKLVHVECYIFHQGEVTRRFMEALIERAKAGVEVKLLVDAIGSTRYLDHDLEPLRKAGGRAAWYHPLRWYSWPRLNNRSHRELIVVDGSTGFIGGAGFADQWLLNSDGKRRWRDTMVRVDGEAVNGLDATFAENWLESAGDILIGPRYFNAKSSAPGKTMALVVGSSPTTGRSTPARILVQSLVAASRKRIHITSPYFLPDRSLITELAKAIRERHVEVKVLVPGKKNDHLMTRRSSRRLYGDLLDAGAKIFEYRPTMLHAKILIVDGVWSVVGSTNMDSRSFGLNDEVNMAFLDSAVATRLEQDFQNDLGESTEIGYAEWKQRPWYEKVHEWAGALIERQQ
jgi:cardiolipin synthase